MLQRRINLYADPFRHTDGFYHQMDSFLRAFQGLQEGHRRASEAAAPPANVYEHGDAYVIELRVPGLREEDFTVQLLEDAVTIRGESRAEVPEGYAAHRQERRGQRFARSFSFAGPLDAERATARLVDGILTVELPRSPEVQPRTIPVRAG